MKKTHRTLLTVGGTIQGIFIASMLGWMAADAYRAFAAMTTLSFVDVIAHPVALHKVGELLIVLPIGFALASMFLFWKPELRRTFLNIAPPIVWSGGTLNAAAAIGFSASARTDFSLFMIFFCIVLCVMSAALPPVFSWMHTARRKVEKIGEASAEKSTTQ